jgi:hypothetical protein
MRNVESQAGDLVYTSVQDALSGAWEFSIPVLKRAIQLEQKRGSPRVALIRGLQTEIRKKEREALGKPKDAA